MFGGKKYSESSLALLVGAIQKWDRRGEELLQQSKLRHIPKNSDFLPVTRANRKDPTRIRLNGRRVAFNCGVIRGFAEIFYDGKPKDIDDFIEIAHHKATGERTSRIRKLFKYSANNFAEDYLEGQQRAADFLKQFNSLPLSDDDLERDGD